MKYILLAFFFFIQLNVFSQIRGTNSNSNSQTTGIANDTQSDTTKNKTKERILTGRLSGDTIAGHINSWVFQDHYLHNKTVEVDTFITDFHIYDKLRQTNASSARLGNIGLASKSNVFFNSIDKYDFIFENSYSTYLITNENLAFYSTNLPFTYIMHSGSSKQVNEQVLNILHTQNVSRKLNVGFRYNVINSKGQMTNNAAIINSAGAWLSYFGTRYNLQTNFVLNKVQNNQNGGIKEEYFVPAAELDPVNLSDAKIKMNNLGFMLHQKYKLGVTKVNKTTIKTDQKKDSTVLDTIFVPFASLNHTFKIKRSFRIYSDETNATSAFYPSYQQASFTFDSVALTKIENVFQIQFNENQQSKFKFRMRAFAKNEIYKHGSSWGGELPENFILNPDFLSRPQTADYTNTSLGGALFDYSSKKWDWNFEAEFFALGRRAGDVLFGGNLERVFALKNDSLIISIKGNYSNTTPSYLYEYYHSNHYNWENQFSKESKLFAGFELSFPKYKFKTQIQLTNIDKFIYFGENSIPLQSNENIKVIATQINKNFVFGKFRWTNNLIYQIISDKTVLQIPDFIYNTQLYASYYLFRKALQVESGIEAEFTSSYVLPNYSPAVGQFYQNTNSQSDLIPSKGGNYPLLSVYANFKVRKVLLFINFRNMNTLWNSSYSYTTYLYPTEKMTFHWGVLWRFYD